MADEPRTPQSRTFDRTTLASDRTALANERTLAAWWRTAMAAFALALGFAKLFGGVEPAWLIRGGATLLAGLGTLMLVVAVRTYGQTAKRLEVENVVLVSRRGLWGGTLLLALIAVAVTAAIWLV